MMDRRAARRIVVVAAILAAVVSAASVADPALAQTSHHPFAIGAGEGSVGRESGIGAWMLAQQSRFYLALTGAIRAAKEGWAGALLLVGLSLAYGILHAAGPGHGKAVLTSYMVSNETALRRGIALACLAALLQGVVATMVVGAAVLVFHATAARITATAQAAEFASYLGIIALGMILLWRKSIALWIVLRSVPRAAPIMLASTGPAIGADFGVALRESTRFVADAGAEPAHGPGCNCGHAHFPDATVVSSRRFDWRTAGLAVASAGARPCSGAILVLVFASAQGIFWIGVASTFAMALGTALTTSLLAVIAVFAKNLARRLADGTAGRRSAAIGRSIEFGAALCVLLFGVTLLAASFAGSTGAA